ncbi:MAG TPA: hypothetical protein VJ773_07700 [Gemmatimonadales bacterium]|nr:hypothetical protein [Gemmatimonadales bacterium]
MPVMRRLAVLPLLLLATACPDYDSYAPLARDKGQVPADQFAAYGSEQAQAVAIGREFAMAYVDATPEGLATQAEAAVAFARRMPDVTQVQADTLGHRLTVTFRSGWVKGIVPIGDGRNAAETPHLPPVPAR